VGYEVDFECDVDKALGDVRGKGTAGKLLEVRAILGIIAFGIEDARVFRVYVLEHELGLTDMRRGEILRDAERECRAGTRTAGSQ